MNPSSRQSYRGVYLARSIHHQAGNKRNGSSIFSVPPKSLEAWLCDQDSLTRRLITASGGDFRVQVIRQGFVRPSRSEQNALALPGRQVAMIREVLLLGRGQPWVYARSVVPLTTLCGRHRFLRHLGSKPLGALLFKDPSMRRGPIELIGVTTAEFGIPVLTGGGKEDAAWGRRSMFYLEGKPLLVAEFFLPLFTATVA